MEYPIPTESEKKAYKSQCEARGFRCGKKLRITRIGHTNEQGWSGNWTSRHTTMVGCVYEVQAIGSGTGSPILGGLYFPHFVCEEADSISTLNPNMLLVPHIPPVAKVSTLPVPPVIEL